MQPSLAFCFSLQPAMLRPGVEPAMSRSRVRLELCDPLTLTFLLFLHVLSVLLPLKLFVCLRLIIGTLFLCISVHLTVLLLSNPVLNLIFLLLSITSSQSHAPSQRQRLRFDLRLHWRYINISLTLSPSVRRPNHYTTEPSTSENLAPTANAVMGPQIRFIQVLSTPMRHSSQPYIVHLSTILRQRRMVSYVRGPLADINATLYQT